MLATSLSKDLYKRFVKPEATDGRVLKVARGAAVAGGLAGVVLAVVIPNVVGALTIFYSLLSVSLFVPVVAGLHSRRPGPGEALAAAAAGVVALLVARSAGFGGWMPPTAWGLVAAGAAFGIFFGARRLTGEIR